MSNSVIARKAAAYYQKMQWRYADRLYGRDREVTANYAISLG